MAPSLFRLPIRSSHWSSGTTEGCFRPIAASSGLCTNSRNPAGSRSRSPRMNHRPQRRSASGRPRRLIRRNKSRQPSFSDSEDKHLPRCDSPLIRHCRIGTNCGRLKKLENIGLKKTILQRSLISCSGFLRDSRHGAALNSISRSVVFQRTAYGWVFKLVNRSTKSLGNYLPARQ